MRKRIVIRLADAGEPFEASWVIHDETEGEYPVVIKTGALAEVAAASFGGQVTVLVPTSQGMLTQVVVPTANRRRMASAVPYALEDQVTSDIEGLHFCLGQRDVHGSVAVAVVAHTVMQEWLYRLNSVGIQPVALLPDVLALPFEVGQWTLLLEDRVATVRTAEQLGFSSDIANLEVMLASALLAAEESSPTLLRVVDCRQQGDPWQGTLAIPLEQLPQHEPAIALMNQALREHPPFDLLQGDYSRKEQLGKLWRPWRPAAALLVVLLLVQFIAALNERVALDQRATALRQEAVNIYLQTFPEAKKVPDPRAQMRQQLEALRGGSSAQGGEEFLALLGLVGEPFKQTQSLQITRLSYRAGKLDVALTLPDLQRLDLLKQQLSDKGKVTIEIQSATSRDGVVEARLHIGRAGA